MSYLVYSLLTDRPSYDVLRSDRHEQLTVSSTREVNNIKVIFFLF